MKTNFSAQMKQILSNYTDEVVEKVVTELEKVGEESAKELHHAGSFKNRTGAYRRGWTSELEGKRTYSSVTIYNKKRYQLAHLLEYGHLKRSGDKRTRAFKHIEVVDENAQKRAVKRIADVIQRLSK